MSEFLNSILDYLKCLNESFYIPKGGYCKYDLADVIESVEIQIEKTSKSSQSFHELIDYAIEKFFEISEEYQTFNESGYTFIERRET